MKVKCYPFMDDESLKSKALKDNKPSREISVNKEAESLELREVRN
jgi:hypothetical protein